MKTIRPMPLYEPPQPKPIEELIGQHCIEERDDSNRRSYANSAFADYGRNDKNPTRPDLMKEEAEEGE